jgi:ABC-type transport system involved in multi-copper enzyme maturation permease subunit
LRSPDAPAGLRSARWLWDKEWRELMASRAWWVLLAAMGPLVGMSFISAVTAYGELSGVNGTAAGVGEAFSPLVGIWAPTFSACELAAAFLLPFVAIRLVSGDKQSGALKIELQHPMSSWSRLSIKTTVLLCGWLLATIAPMLGVVLWIGYGGDVYPPELATVIVGHVLNGALTIALAAAAAALTEHPATAAIVTLTVTVGTWLVNFAAAVNGGWWERAARVTPTAMVGEFQRGLLRADIVIVAVTLIGAGLAVAAIWLRLGSRMSIRIRQSLVVGAVAAIVLAVAPTITASWDTSESRRNSFPDAAVEALRSVNGRLGIVAHFAPEDPRRSDLEYNAFRKLRRALPGTTIEYRSATSTGLFEQTSEKYGEIDYSLDGRTLSSRVTTAEGVLESVFTLAGITPPAESADDIFRGHPLAARPSGAAAVFYVVWPAAIAAMALVVQRRQR